MLYYQPRHRIWFYVRRTNGFLPLHRHASTLVNSVVVNKKSTATTNERLSEPLRTVLDGNLKREPMAEAILFNVADGILASLGSSALQGIGSVRGVKEELRKLESAISATGAVLLDAEEKRAQNPSGQGLASEASRSQCVMPISWGTSSQPKLCGGERRHGRWIKKMREKKKKN